jgi:hypothetical protein
MGATDELFCVYSIVEWKFQVFLCMALSWFISTWRHRRKKEAWAPKRARDELHPLERRSIKRDCSLCRPRLSNGQHGPQTHFACADCNVFLPNCYNRHIQALAQTSIESVDE